MSLDREAFSAAIKRRDMLDKKVNILFIRLGLPLNNKVQMDHYGNLFLFGKPVSNTTTNCTLKRIISETPKEFYDMYDMKIGFFAPNEEGWELNRLDRKEK